jgi:predicted membrane protein
MTISDVIGLIGVAFILFAYAGVQSGRLPASDWRFSAVNGAGALLIMISLFFTFNLASFVIEVFWLLISAFGLWKAWRRRSADQP